VLAYNGSAWEEYRKAGAGQVLQVVSTTKTDTFSMSSTTFADITGFSVSITPTSTSSKIYVSCTISCGNDLDAAALFRLVRGATDIAIADTAGSRIRTTTVHYDGVESIMGTVAFTFLDSPSTTSATTYKVQMSTSNNTQSVHVNRTHSDSDAANIQRGVSTITLMEIAG
jgi:hypothetical protein